MNPRYNIYRDVMKYCGGKIAKEIKFESKEQVAAELKSAIAGIPDGKELFIAIWRKDRNPFSEIHFYSPEKGKFTLPTADWQNQRYGSLDRIVNDISLTKRAYDEAEVQICYCDLED